MHRRLRLVDECHLRRLVYSHLFHHLRTDGSRSTGDEHPLALEHLSDGVHVHLYLFARKQVFNLNLAQLVVGQFRFAVPFLGGRHHHYLYASLHKLVHHRLVVAELLSLQRRHEQHLHVQVSHLLGDALLVQIHPLAHDIRIAHIRSVADESL